MSMNLGRWREFATGLNQDVVLITHWPVQTIGEIG